MATTIEVLAPGAGSVPTSRLTRARSLALDVWPAVAGFALTRVATFLVLWLMGVGTDRNPWTRLGRADAQHFLLIVEHGWHVSPKTLPDGTVIDRGFAFFPGFPLVVRALAELPLLTPFGAALVVSAVAGALAAALIYLVGREFLDRRAALLLPVLWGAQLIAVVLSMPYSESLFTALAAGSLLALLRRRWVWAGLLCAGAGATRATGFALMAALGIAALLAALRRQDGWRPYAAVALAPLGTLAYFAYVHQELGRWDGWFYVQRAGFGAGFDGGAFQARAVLKSLTTQDAFIPTFAVLVLAVLVLGFVLLLQHRPPLPLVVYTAVVLVLALGQSGFHHSKPRLLLPAFPLLVGFAAILARAPRRVVVGVLALVVLVSAWYGSYNLLLSRYAP